MLPSGYSQIVVYVIVLIALAAPLGRYMAWIYTRERDDAVERGFFRLFGRGSGDEQDWKRYGLTVVGFSAIFSLVLYAAAIPLALPSPKLACGIYAAIALVWLVPDRRIERALRQH